MVASALGKLKDGPGNPEARWGPPSWALQDVAGAWECQVTLGHWGSGVIPAPHGSD